MEELQRVFDRNKGKLLVLQCRLAALTTLLFEGSLAVVLTEQVPDSIILLVD
jgi:hypothetical protein